VKKIPVLVVGCVVVVAVDGVVVTVVGVVVGSAVAKYKSTLFLHSHDYGTKCSKVLS